MSLKLFYIYIIYHGIHLEVTYNYIYIIKLLYYFICVREQPRGVATTRLKRPSLPAATCGPLESCLYRHVYTGAGGISPPRPPLGVVTYDNM